MESTHHIERSKDRYITRILRVANGDEEGSVAAIRCGKGKTTRNRQISRLSNEHVYVHSVWVFVCVCLCVDTFLSIFILIL